MVEMREKKWIDCPVCGSKGSMRKKRGIRELAELKGYPSVEIDGLSGQFCEICGDGFWSLRSERKIARELTEHMAQHDATRVVAADLSSVQEAAKALHVTPQGVHKMMDDGRLRYVYAGGFRLPIRKYVAEKAKLKARGGNRGSGVGVSR